MLETIKTKEALKAVDLDQTTFSNAVAKGDYDYLLETMRGSSRDFDDPKLIALWIFSRLIEGGNGPQSERLSVKEAAKLAKRIGLAAEENPDADQIIEMTHMNGLIKCFAASKKRHAGLLDGAQFSGAPIRDARIWDLRNIREQIARDVEFHRSTETSS
jgi:hypothetical protein